MEELDNQGLSTEEKGYFKVLICNFNKMFHVEHFRRRFNLKCSTWNNRQDIVIFAIPLFFLFWSFFSMYWSENKVISLYRSFKFLEAYLLFLYVAFRIVPRGTFLDDNDGNKDIVKKVIPYFKAILFGLIFITLFDHYLWDIWQGQVLFWIACGLLVGFEFCTRNGSNFLVCKGYKQSNEDQVSVKTNNVPRGTSTIMKSFFVIIIGVGFIQALIGILQFILTHSIGLFWLKESQISPHIAGVAKIIFNDDVFIRAYGLFPHPNILGGFLVFSIIITTLYLKMFHVEHLNNKLLKKCSTWNILNKKEFNNVPRGTFSIFIDLIKFNYLNVILVAQFVAILLSFSKSAILALIIAFLYIYVPRGTSSVGMLRKMFHVEHFKLKISILAVFISGVVFLSLNYEAYLIKSTKERMDYIAISWQIISSNPIIGVGTGQYIINAEIINPNLAYWQYQPVHNVFLFIWSELGIVGLVLFILFLWKLFHLNEVENVPRGTFKE
ncbi:MAG: O-antigen ligase family protein [Candidatus Moraniibacteriota bacterium]